MIFDNAYQLEQVVTIVGDWYGCGLKCSGTVILCACGKTQKQQKEDLDKHQKTDQNLHHTKKTTRSKGTVHLNQIYVVP